MVEVHQRRRVHRDAEGSTLAAASTAAITSTSRSEHEYEEGYESSPSDYSDIWNDYHWPSKSDCGHLDAGREDEEAKKTYDQLCTEPPQAPSPEVGGSQYGEGSS